MRTFVVECYWPGMLEEDARNILDRVIQPGGKASPGRSVWFLGCVLVPGDGMALFLLTAPSEDVVRRAGRQAEVPFDRIAESVLIGFGQQLS
jgi:hypothetical protein